MSANGKQSDRQAADEAARLAQWDAEIEAEFQGVVAGTRAANKAKRGRRLIAFPFSYLRDVCRLTKGQAALVVAEVIYRRTHVCSNRTVTLPGAELAELGIDRPKKSRALAQLQRAGLIRIEQPVTGRTHRVTLLWRGQTVA
jgi:hypothetical protein